MGKVKKVWALVPDGTGIKNYLYSKIFRDDEIELTLFHNFDADTLRQIQQHVSIKESVEIPAYKESIKEKFLRELIHRCRLWYNSEKLQNPTIKTFWKSNHKSWKLKLFYGSVVFASKFIGSYGKMLKLEEKYQKSLRKNTFYEKVKEILKSQEPDLVFCTHQRALKAPTVFAAATDLGIKTSTVIYSWDNLPKARLALQSDDYYVWSEHMKLELRLFYKEISEEKIKITGTPQFEFYYGNDHIIEKKEFYSSYGLDSNKTLICFSGDDELTSPYDPHYLNDLAEAITNSGWENKYTIVFRRCPVDVSGRYDWVVEKYKDLIVEMPPLWNFNSKKWTAVYPTFDDVKLLVSLAFYADLVVNVGSTMAFDFGMFNKPCVYINYDHVPDPKWSVDIIYKYPHFRSMPHENTVYWFDSKENISGVLDTALNSGGNQIKKWFQIIVAPHKIASEEIQKLLKA
ncbi:MAG: hypothetical protein HKN48_01140 [Flavobacteriaceae bacterium]|nr:hypothetical protein [Flavobacteriaceae bacterium]